MAVKLPSNLSRNRYGVLYFRLAVPPDLRQHFQVREIYRSLHTASIRQATITAQTLSIALKQVFREIRQQFMSNQNKAPTNALEVFANLPDVRDRLRAAGIQIALLEAEAARDRAEDRHAESEEQRAKDKAQHERELALVMQAKTHIPEPTKNLPTSPLLSETVNGLVREKRAKDRWTEKTEIDYRAVYDLFIRIVGDKPISDISDEIIISYLETLKKLPANINKAPAYIGKSIAEIIALSPPPMAVGTVNKNVERVSALFKWAMSKAKYGITRNPAAGMSLDESGAAKREPFTAPELAALFGADEFITKQFENPYAYWLMLLGLLTGARLGELCQLYLSDFVIEKDVHCLEISDEEEGQRVKNKSAKRLVPIHDKLIELGLLRYVKALEAKGETRLFPELNQRRDGFAQAASNWFQRYKKKCGIMDKHTKVFHSFRHTFISALLDDGEPEHAVGQIVGHEAQLITGKVYWNTRDATKRKPTVDKYQPPPEVWQLIPKFEDITISKRRGRKSASAKAAPIADNH